MDKLQMAHEYAKSLALNPAVTGTNSDLDIVERSWQYADAMQAEADKRNKAEAEEERKYIRELLNADNTFIEKEGQHFDDVEWQPDWSQAPGNAKYWAMDKDGLCNWYENKPEICDDQWDFGDVIEVAPQFTYTNNWQESLRKRPHDL